VPFFINMDRNEGINEILKVNLEFERTVRQNLDASVARLV